MSASWVEIGDYVFRRLQYDDGSIAYECSVCEGDRCMATTYIEYGPETVRICSTEV